MASYLKLTMDNRSKGYRRSELRGDVLYGYFSIRDISVNASRNSGTVTRIKDSTADKMLAEGYIYRQVYDRYLQSLNEDIFQFDRFDDYSSEEIYAYISKIRRAVFGDALDKYTVKVASEGRVFLPDGIDMTAKKEMLLKKSGAVVFALTQPEFFETMLNDIRNAERKEVWVLCDPALVSWLPRDVRVLTLEEQGVSSDEVLQGYIDSGEACMFVYGEEGLTACRGLAVDSVIHAYPVGYYAQAVTGLWSGEGCVVFVPKGTDMTLNVPLIKKTRLNYSVMYSLWKDMGDSVYSYTLEELYNRFPKYFINIYSGRPEGLPIEIKADSLSDFDRQLDEGLGKYLSGFDNAEYRSAYFDEGLVQQPIGYDSTAECPGILVQAVKIKQAENARIISCEKGKTPRQTFEQMQFKGTGIVSNFLFFMTPKLGVLYNDLRSDCSREQADAASGHLDYMRNEAKETFPLFAKSCIAKKEDGRFLFFNHRLEGGRVCISGIDYRWEREDVNSCSSRIRVYTPTLAAEDRDADRNTYRKEVGEGRVNVVILRDKVTCIRKGGVLLPSVGVVLSLTEETAAPLLEKCMRLEDGYYEVSDLTLDVKLDPPKGISDEEWEKVCWAYGGGLTLIKDGVGLCDGDNMEKWFEEEGWTNPLSRQTQESNLHSLVKHPRTAIGQTADGSLVILVYSGRTWRSTGADYREMIEIARQLFPDVRYLMNCDGGGSAMLGMVHDGSFLELSFPSTSSGSCAGQVRPINTVFYIPIG